MELGNEAEGKVSKILEDGIFGERVTGDATLSKIHTNNQDGLQRKAVPGKELQVEFKELPVSMDARQRVSARGGAAETQEQFTQRLNRSPPAVRFRLSPRRNRELLGDYGHLTMKKKLVLLSDDAILQEVEDVIGVEHVGVAEKYHGGIKDKGRCDAGWRNTIHSSPYETGSVQRLSSSPLMMHVFITIRCKESK
ncbi:hypothetical protein DY000_02002498 [Brassica cretica]|uniref:Uncharacterized protein n=1 Tax=Brassica cretica TaxID=69181 RepID=A0ABQ7CD43_BRACR|nr:hypothetical protein DY000_02002498 [Brassica cretica]